MSGPVRRSPAAAGSRLLVAAASVAVAVAALSIAATSAPAPVRASHTPDPASVTLVGSLQSEAGCGGDWDPACAATHLTYDADDDVWQGTFALPAGSYEYKVALDDSWDENYGLNSTQDGPNIPLALASAGSVKFYYDHGTHWATDDRRSVIAVAPGSFQSELGCSGDWDPGCLRSWLQDPTGSGTYRFETTALPTGSYEAKVAIDEGWDENYGLGGAPGGANIPFTVPQSGRRVVMTYDPVTHVLSIVVDAPGLALTKSASPTTYTAPGQVITYSYVATNTGNVTLAGPVTLADDRLGAFACGTATSLAAGASVTCARTYVIAASDVNVAGTGSITNHAVAGATWNATPVASNQAVVTVRQSAARPTDPPIVLAFSPGSGRPGSLVTVSGLSLSYARSVTIGGRAAAFSVRSPTLIVATVPAGAATGPIRVATPFGSGQSTRSFVVLP